MRNVPCNLAQAPKRPTELKDIPVCHCILGHSAIAELSSELQYSTTKGVSEVGLLVCMCLPSQPFTDQSGGG